jgi:hypothetical protein
MPLTKGYWANFQYRKAVPSSIEKLLASVPAELRPFYAKVQHQRLEHVQNFCSNSVAASSSWEDTFDKFPHSNNKLRELLPAAIRSTTAMASSNKSWNSPSDFPPPVLEW